MIRRFFPFRLPVWGLCLCAMLPASPAQATDAVDLAVGLKTLPLLADRIASPVTMAVVFDPANPESRRDADVIKAAADASPRLSGGQALVALPVAVTDLPSLKGLRLIFLAQGVGGHAFDVVSETAATAGVLSITADLSCVNAGKCVIGIVSRPTVEVFFSATAADRAHVEFTPAFAMLAKRV
ncbi:MAG: hypothetical protein F8N37_13125 [Telmatospirillum sp.]|nr:hypothetical protein [Telmatospirillum sp.]